MIARVQISDFSPVTVTLNDDLTWECAQFTPIAETLNILHAGTFTEWNGAPGYWQAHDAAAKFGGHVDYLKTPD
jgi:hypothetical protein